MSNEALFDEISAAVKNRDHALKGIERWNRALTNAEAVIAELTLQLQNGTQATATDTVPSNADYTTVPSA